MAKKTSTAPAASQINTTRGFLFSLLAIPVGIVLWIVLWRFGFIASIVSFAIAYLAVWLYKYGSRSTAVARKDAPMLLVIIVAGIFLAFLSGMASDATMFYAEQAKVSETQALMDSGFWGFFGENVFANGELWGSYTTDILITLAFGALGSFGVIRELFVTPQPAAKTK